MLIGTEVDLGPGVIVLDGDPTPELLRTEMGTAAAGPTFGICLLLDEADSLIRCWLSDCVAKWRTEQEQTIPKVNF